MGIRAGRLVVIVIWYVKVNLTDGEITLLIPFGDGVRNLNEASLLSTVAVEVVNLLAIQIFHP